TMVVEWLPAGAAGAAVQAQAQLDPWVEGCRRDDRKGGGLRFKRGLLTALAEHGAERAVPDALPRRTSPPPIGDEGRPRSASDGPVVRMVDQEIVREAFYLCTPEDPRQTQRSRFERARDRAEWLGLIQAGNIDDVTYLWLVRENEQEQD